MRNKIHFAILIVVFTAAASHTSAAQVVTGIQPFGSFGGGPEVINLGNLNLHLGIPIASKRGRGLNFSYTLGYDSSVWYKSSTWIPVSNWGWTAETQTATGYVTATTNLWKCFQGTTWYWATTYANWIYVDRVGTSHSFVLPTISDCPRFPSQASGNSGDGYQITAYAGGATLWDLGGHILYPPFNAGTGSGQALDTNGNEITFNGTAFTDTLGKTVLTISGTNPVLYTYTGPSGTKSYSLSYVSRTVKTNFGCSGVGEYGPTSVSLVDKITLPDGLYYQFSYEPTPGFSGDVTGRIASVKLPTGGTITYSYSGGSNGITCADGTTATLGRSTPDGTWSYAHTESGSAWTTVITDPKNDSTTINFQSLGGRSYETERQVSDVSSGLLETLVTCYNGNISANCNSTAITTSLISRKTVVVQPAGAGSLESEIDTTYNTYGLPTKTDEYDYGTNGSPGPLLRETDTSYASLSNDIQDHPYQVQVYDGSLHLQAQTTYLYDQGTPIATTGTPQHLNVSGSRGNLTTLEKQVNGTTTLYRVFTYYDTGNLNTATDWGTTTSGGPNLTTYTYGTGSCGNSFVTSISEPLGLSRSMTYDGLCNGGVVTSVTDENGNVTSTAYTDPYYWRPASVSYPDGGQDSFTYNTSSTPWYTIKTSKITSSTNRTTETILDGLGRISTAELTSDPSGTDYTVTNYDSLGRVASVTNPYRSTSDSTYGLTQYSYDALGRTTIRTNPDNSTVQMSYAGAAGKVQNEAGVAKVYQADGAGRLISACEVTNATQVDGTSPSACNQNIPATGFLTTYAYDSLNDLTAVTQGTQTRTYGYDELARITSESNPEWGGVVSYVYDTNSAGDLYQRIRPAPNQQGSATVTTSYGYDALHRLNGVTYNDGTTPSVGITYDQSSSTNGKGRLSAFYVGGSIAEQFSYDAMGRTTYDYQYLPSAIYYWQSNYDLIGDLLNGFSAGGSYYVNWTNTFNTAGQLTQVSSSWLSPTQSGNLVSGIQYNALGEPTSDTLGNGLPESWTYDKLGRRVGYYTGPTGTYQYCCFTFNGSELTYSGEAGNGNWTYTYDDFGRLATASCSVSGCVPASFSYAYDRFGNRWQQNLVSGSGGPSPQYAFNAQNRIVGVSYDAAGNILNDGSHSYTYDAENRLIQVDGGGTATYTYDGRGRRRSVTTAAGPLWYVYDLASRVVSRVNPNVGQLGTTLSSETYVAGRHLATQNGTSTFFPLVDWLGTTRMTTDLSGNSVETCVNLPFGDGRNCTGSMPDPIQFTGLSHDTESGLDQAVFRQYSSTQGHWISPDPAGMAVASSADPQSWNRYAYVDNGPMGAIDPDGTRMRQFASIPGGGGGDGMLSLYIGMGDTPGFALAGYLVAAPGTTMTLQMPSGNDITYVVSQNNTWVGPNGEDVSNGIAAGELQLPALNPVGFYVLSNSGTVISGGVTIPRTPSVANNGNKTAPNPKSNCKTGGNANVSGTASDLENLASVYSAVTHPLDVAAVNASMFLASGAQFFGGTAVIAAGCGEPSPAEPATCAAGIFAGVHAYAGGTITGGFAIKFLKEQTIPAFESWGCPE